MPDDTRSQMSRRERQIMDVVYRRGEATAQEIQTNLPEPPSYSAVRGLLRILEEKGHLKHRQDGPRYVYRPTVPRDKARRGALNQMLQTFFDGSPLEAVAALLDLSAEDLNDEQLDQLEALIERARKEGR